MDAEVGGEPVMPYMQRLKREGVWFENFFANSFRTDRGEVAILSGFPAQTRMSVMKLPAKSRSPPSVARSLAGEGYATSLPMAATSISRIRPPTCTLRGGRSWSGRRTCVSTLLRPIGVTTMR